MEHGNQRLQAIEAGEILNAVEAARILRISKQSMIRRFEDKTIPAVKIGNRWRVSATVIANVVPRM